MINEPWSKQDIAQLRRLVKKGLSRTQIGARMGRTKNSICGAVNRYVGTKAAKIQMVAAVKRKGGNGREGCRSYAVSSLDIPPPQGEGVHLLDLAYDRCRYPMAGRWMFCGEPKTQGCYCAKHAKLCYRPPQAATGRSFRIPAWKAA